MVAVIRVDFFKTFLAFSDLTYHLEETGVCASGCTVLPDSKKHKHVSSKKETSPLASKNTEVVLVPHYTWKCVISGDVNIS